VTQLSDLDAGAAPGYAPRVSRLRVCRTGSPAEPGHREDDPSVVETFPAGTPWTVACNRASALAGTDEWVWVQHDGRTFREPHWTTCAALGPPGWAWNPDGDEAYRAWEKSRLDRESARRDQAKANRSRRGPARKKFRGGDSIADTPA
jgi:hypothetical protein